MSNLGAGFPLRCFQRLSLPDVATRRLPLARQPVHQRSVLLGPLVLKQDPLRHPTPMADRDRTVSRRSEPSLNSWARSACYPRSTFYPLSDGASTCHRQITKTCFRTCSTCRSRSQATLCLYTCRMIPDHPKVTFARLRYPLGGDRPSQTSRLALSPGRITVRVRNLYRQGWYFTIGSPHPDGHGSLPPTYPTHADPGLNAKLK